MSKLNIKLLNGAVLPKQGTAQSAGYDLYAYEEVAIEPNTLGKVRIGIFITCPKNSYGRIAPRSGLAFKNWIDVFAGVIDRDYTDEIMVLLFNHGPNTFKISKGDRIAQIIFEKICNPTFNILSDDTKLNETDRKGGFGSTGTK
jgi:dUTP pyrophosphatase